MKIVAIPLAVSMAMLLSRVALGSEQDVAKVAALDTQYQEAVKANDYATMDKLLARNFVLVVGSGHVFRRGDLIGEARKATEKWEHQEEFDGSRTVRVWGDTAVVTAKLWIKGAFRGQPLDMKVWFSDTYIRTRAGWKYVFGQASLPVEQ